MAYHGGLVLRARSSKLPVTDQKKVGPKPSGDFLHLAARGGMWLAVGQAVATAGNWVAMLILARLITPEGFGLVAMATVFLGFALVISDLGLTSALIQRRELDDAHKDSAFWSSLGMGVVLFSLALLLAPALGRWYVEPRVTHIVVVAAIPLLLGPFSSTYAALLRRRLKFNAVARLELMRSLVSAVVMVSAAFVGLNHWAILLGPIAGHLVAIPAYHLASAGWRPRFRASWRHTRELLSFSMYVAGGGAVNFLSANVDYLIVGRVLGPAALGVYTLAYQIVTVPLTRISSLFSQVMFPAFSSIQDQPEAMRDAYVRITRSVAMISFPLLGWGFVVAPELLEILCGPQWLGAAPLIRLLSVAGAVKSVGTLVGIVFRAKGKAFVELYWNIVWAMAVTVGVIVGVRFGNFGVAAAISVLSVPGVLYTEWLACKYLQLPLRRLLGVLVLPSLGAIIGVSAGMATRHFLPESEPGLPWAVLRLMVLSIVTWGSTGVAMRIWEPRIAADVRAFIDHFRAQRRWHT